MTRTSGLGWWKTPKWLRAHGNWVRRVSEGLVKDEAPEWRVKQLEDVLAAQIRLFGLDGGPTANARDDLAKQLEGMGRFTEARILREEVFAANQRHRGDEDSDTLTAEERLALNLANSGLTEDAKPLLAHICEVRLRTLGPEHKDTQRVARVLKRLVKPDD